MDEPLKLRIDQFSIQAGNWQQHPANINIMDAATRKSFRGRGSLAVLIEAPHGTAMPQSLYGELMTIISDTYYNASGSITRGLRAAILAANTLLFELNLRSDSEHRVVLGLNCAAIRDNEVFMAQIGPALTSLVHQGELVRYPSDSVWLRSESPGTFDINREPPVGLRREVEPNLLHANLAIGDVLILSSTALVRLVSDDALVRTMESTGNESPRGNLEAVVKGRDVSALVIECYGEQRPLATSPSHFTPSSPSVTPPDPLPAVKSTAEKRLAVSSDAEAPLPQATPSARTVAQAAPSPSPEMMDQGGRVDAERAPREPAPPLVDLSNLRDNLAQGAQKVRRNAENLLDHVLPDTLPQRPSEPQPTMPLPGKALVVVSLAIPLLVLLLVIMTRMQYERTRRSQFGEIKGLAQSRFDTALSKTDRAAMRLDLSEALSTTEEGLAIDSSDETLNALKRRILRKFDEMDGIQRLFHFWQLADLGDDPTSLTDSSRIVIEGINVFVLNRGSDRVFKYMLNDVGDALQPVDKTPLLMAKGELRDGLRVGDIVDIAWMAGEGTRSVGRFMALDRSGSLLSYDPQQGIRVLPVANSDIWRKPEAIGCFEGNLYVLDPILNRMLKYVPTDNTYINPPADYISADQNVDLTGAVDMTIDGNMYVLFADGKIDKFLKGLPKPFTLQGLPTPMRSPTVIFVSGPKKADAPGYVYVADTGNERILQFNKDGIFVRQLQANVGEPQMVKMRGLYVDESRGRMFIRSGRTLWLCELPGLDTKQPS